MPTVYSVTPTITIRWGIPREPAWVYGDETTAPGAGTTLVSQTVTTGKTGRVFGVSICSPEANDFRLYAGSTVRKRYSIASAGTFEIVLGIPILDAIAAGTVITIKNVTAATAGLVYKADLLYDEA